MKNAIAFLVLLLFSGSATFAQNSETLRQAFLTSYEKETEEKFDEAIAALTAVYQENAYETNLRLGWLYYLKGDYFKSKDHYRRATQLLPYSVEAKLGYVYPLAALGSQNEVITTYEQILNIDPKNSQANYWLGAIYYTRSEYEKALQHTEIVVNMYPFDYDSLVLLGWINLQIGQRGRAKTLFEKALLNQPSSTSAQDGLKLCN